MRRNRSCQRTAAILSAAIGLSAVSAWASVDTWIGGNGSWSIASNWTPTGQPAGGDNVFLNQSAFTITYDAAAIDANIATLNISNQQTLTQGASNSLSVTQMLNVNGGSILWNAGTLTVGQSLGFGTFSIGSGANGTMTFSGGALNVFSQEIIGDAGNGVLNQTGGINTVSDSSGGGGLMKVGNGGAGTYNLSAGTINATTEYIGYGGAGTFNQTGGLHQAVETIVGVRNVGTYLLSGGTLVDRVETFLGGDQPTGNGTFINSGGLHQTAYLYLGDNQTGQVETYNLKGTGVLQSQQEYIGNTAGTSNFVQSGGTHTVSTETSISEGGNFQLQAGTYTANALTLLHIQPNTTAPTFTQTGGVANIAHFNNGTLTQNTNEPGGTFLLQGGSFTATDSFIVGGSTTVQNGATFSTNDLQFVGGQLFVDGRTGNGTTTTLNIGPGGLVFGSSAEPTIVLGIGTGGAKLVLNGDVSFTGLSGNAGIGALTVFPTTFTPTVDLAGGNRTFTIADGADPVDFSISALIVNGSITKNGLGQMDMGTLDATIGSVTVNAGTLIMSEPNAFIGNVNMNGGTLSIFDDTGLGNPSNQLKFNGGALQTMGNENDSRTITIGANGGTFDVVAGTTHTINTSITGSSIFGKTGEGTLSLATTNTFTGALTVQRGTVKLSGANASLPNISTVSVYPLSTFDLDNSSANPTNPAGFVNDSADLSLNGGTFTFLPLSGGASTETLHQLIPSSGGSNVVEGAAGATATLNFSGGLGTRQPGATVNFVISDPGNTNKVLFNGYSTPDIIGGWATINGVAFATYGGTGVATFTGETATYSPNCFYKPSGTTIIAGGDIVNTLDLVSPAMFIRTIDIRNGNGILAIADGGLIQSGVHIGVIEHGTIESTNGELDVYTNNTLDVSSIIADSPTTSNSLIKSGPGSLFLNGTNSNTYTGMTEVHAGTLALAETSSTATNLAVPGNLLIDGGAVVLDANEQISDSSNVTLSAGTFNLNGFTETINSLTNSGGTLLTGGGTLIVNSPHTTVLSAGTTIISGGSLNSTGMLVSGGLNTVQSAGIINVGTAGLAFSSNRSPAITLNADTTTPGKMTLNGDVSFTGSDGTAYISTSAVGSGQLPGVIDLGGGSRTFTVNDGAAATDMEISAQITNGMLVKNGAGLLRLTATNTYSGGTTLNDGTLQIVNSQGLGSGTVMFNGGFLSLESDAPQTNVNFALSATSTATTTVNVDRAFTRSTTGQFILNQAAFGSRFNLSGGSGGSLSLGNVTLESANVVINNSIPLTVGYIGGGGFEKTGAGTFTLNGFPADPNNPMNMPYGYTVTATVDAGVVELDNPSGTTVQTSLVINGPGIVRLLTNDQIANAASITLNGATGTALLDLNNFSDTVGSVSFVAGGVVTTGTGTITVAGSVNFTGASGSGSISGNMNLGTGTRTFSVDDGSAIDDLVVGANISGTGGIVKAGAGELNLKGADTFTGGVTVNAGTLVLGSSHTLTSLAINNTSHVKLAVGAHQASLILAEPTIASGAQLDAANNDLILRSATPSDVRGFLHSGYGAGAWNGTGGIDSTAAASQSTTGHKTALAFATVAQLNVSSFDGFTSLSPTDILIRYAASGDANMDGVVNALDFNAVASNYGNITAAGKFWRDGDFNYDGSVNSSDFDAIAGNFGYVLQTTGGDVPADEPTAALGVLTPEPSTALIFSLFIGSNWMSRRRRRAALFV